MTIFTIPVNFGVRSLSPRNFLHCALRTAGCPVRIALRSVHSQHSSHDSRSAGCLHTLAVRTAAAAAIAAVNMSHSTVAAVHLSAGLSKVSRATIYLYCARSLVCSGDRASTRNTAHACKARKRTPQAVRCGASDNNEIV